MSRLRFCAKLCVDENRITSLGTIVYQPLLRSSAATEDSGTPYLVSRYDDMEDLTDFVSEAYPEVYQRLDDSVLLGWEPGAMGEIQHDELAALLPAASVAMNHVALDERHLAIAGTLGQIFWRPKEIPEWSRIDTGYTHQLAALTKTPEGYLAGGERGLIVRAETLEGPWTRQRGPGTQEAVYWLHSNGEGKTFALTRGRDEARFYSVSDDFETWKEIAKFDTAGGFFSTGSRQVHAIAPNNGTIIVFGDKQRMVYHIDDGELAIEESPTNQACRKTMRLMPFRTAPWCSAPRRILRLPRRQAVRTARQRRTRTATSG